MTAFSVDIPVRFGDTDPAGIVFYPRYFEMMNAVVEDWFAQELGLPFRQIHREGTHGVPILSVEASFTNPSRLGDVLRFTLTVERLGTKSMTMKIMAHCDSEERLAARQVVVWTTVGDVVRAEPIPEPLRGRIAAFLE
jgi:4-hydroxybenzoyl-CoA thioesterase